MGCAGGQQGFPIAVRGGEGCHTHTPARKSSATRSNCVACLEELSCAGVVSG